MKKQDLLEVKKQDTKTLLERSKKLQKEIGSFVIDKNTNQLQNLKSIFAKKRDLAQVLTVLNQKLTLEKLEGAKDVR